MASFAWEDLPENLRDANRRVLAHLPAKLASAGVPLDSWIAARRRHDPTAVLPQFPDFVAYPALLEKLAGLEHERWMAERRLAGWRYGARRDDARRLHPDLVPFEQLSEPTRAYDVAIVATLASALDRQQPESGGA